MPKIIHTTLKSPVSGAISDAFSTFQELRDEMAEWANNMEEKFGSTQKYEDVRGAADALDGFADNEPTDIPEAIADDEITLTAGRKSSKKSPHPRYLRRDNAVASLDAVMSHIEEKKATLEEVVNQLDTAASDFEDADPVRTAEIVKLFQTHGDSDLEVSIETIEELKSNYESVVHDLGELYDELDNAKSEAEGVEFPGMFG